ncbi:MAG: TM2 domain-containing protein [Limimaricola soesokkakensis]|uniref:TM2 domain-containing protein n=1 Tax=Limimaricola soesokkakensis TaxID=1343159 RepID=UPI00405A48D5
MTDDAQQTDAKTPDGTKALSTAMLLALFLGPFGAHRFYMGHKGSAAMMLMLAVTIVGLSITAIWLLIDLPRLPAMICRHNDAIAQRRALDRRSATHGFPLLN